MNVMLLQILCKAGLKHVRCLMFSSKYMVEMLARIVETWYDATSILKVGSSLVVGDGYRIPTHFPYGTYHVGCF